MYTLTFYKPVSRASTRKTLCSVSTLHKQFVREKFIQDFMLDLAIFGDISVRSNVDLLHNYSQLLHSCPHFGRF